MQPLCPVLVGGNRQQLELVVARFYDAEDRRKILGAYAQRSEVELYRWGIVFRARPNGEWALAYSGIENEEQHDLVIKRYSGVPGLKFIRGREFLDTWGFRGEGEAIFRVMHCPSAAGASWHCIGTMRFSIVAARDGSYERAVECTPFARATSENRQVMETASAFGTRQNGRGMHLPVNQDALIAFMRWYGRTILDCHALRDRGRFYDLMGG